MDWVVAGAVAALFYRADARFTTDLDLLVTWDDRLPAACEEAGWEVVAHADEGERPHLLLLRRESRRVDLIVAVVDYQEQAIRRGLAEHRLTVEDVIVHKLLAWRPRDRDDMASILDAGDDLDEGYVEHWASEWDVLDRWRTASAGRPEH